MVFYQERIEIKTETEQKVTLETLEEYIKLYNLINDFFKKKCGELIKAESPSWSDPYPKADFTEFEITENEIQVNFAWSDGSPNWYYLPKNIVFDDDFFEKIKVIYDEKRKADEETKKNR